MCGTSLHSWCPSFVDLQSSAAVDWVNDKGVHFHVSSRPSQLGAGISGDEKQNLYYKAMPAGFEWEKMLGPPFPTDRALGFGIFLLLIAFDVQVISLGLSSRCVMIK